jgi:hypothetical protein
MKLLHCLTALALVLTAPVTHAEEKSSGKETADGKKAAEIALPGYESAEQITAMLPCKATVEESHGCYSVFTTADGKKFSIGGPGATKEVVRFLQTLKDGESYELPGAFLDYQKKKKAP